MHAHRVVVDGFLEFMETGTPPDGLFTADAFCDFTMPRWRVQARGIEEIVSIRKAAHPGTGTVPRWRADPIPGGLVLEWEERWEQDGQQWYCREMLRAQIVDGAIGELSVYCTGDWDEARVREHQRRVSLMRP